MGWFSFLRRHDEPHPRVGLVLGGGAVRGAAHLGALTVLESAGFRPDVVAGTSVGAIIGAGIAAGVSAESMWEVFRTLDWRQVARPSWRSKLSVFQYGPLSDLISRVIPVSAIEELPVPFAAVSCDLLTGSRVVLRSGDLKLALTASASIPVIFEPIPHEGALLVDGGVIDNLPVDVARDLGAEYVVAIDVMPVLDGSYVPGDMRDVALMAFNILQHNTWGGSDDADVLLAPDLVRISPSDFKQAENAYRAGMAAAEQALPRIVENLGLTPKEKS